MVAPVTGESPAPRRGGWKSEDLLRRLVTAGPDGCDLLTHDDPASTIAALRELTGLGAEPVPSPDTTRRT